MTYLSLDDAAGPLISRSGEGVRRVADGLELLTICMYMKWSKSHPDVLSVVHLCGQIVHYDYRLLQVFNISSLERKEHLEIRNCQFGFSCGAKIQQLWCRIDPGCRRMTTALPSQKMSVDNKFFHIITKKDVAEETQHDNGRQWLWFPEISQYRNVIPLSCVHRDKGVPRNSWNTKQEEDNRWGIFIPFLN